MYIIANEISDEWGTTEYLDALNKWLVYKGYTPQQKSPTYSVILNGVKTILNADYFIYTFQSRTGNTTEDVAIATVGSDPDNLECMLRDISNQPKIKMIVCGTKTKGSTVNLLYSILTNRKTIWIRAPHMDKTSTTTIRNTILHGGYVEQVKYLISEILNVNI